MVAAAYVGMTRQQRATLVARIRKIARGGGGGTRANAGSTTS
jgi:hypothetical protein